MFDQPLFSVAIPTHNRLNFLKKAVGSVLSQTYPNVEIVILNNASVDGTKEWLDDLILSHKNMKVIHHLSNLGFVGNVKIIPQNISGKYLVVLSDDDWLDPDFAKEAVSDMKSCPEATVWYCRTKIINQKNGAQRLTVLSPRVEKGIDFVNNWLLVKREVFWCATVYKVKSLKEIGWFCGNTITLDASSRALCAVQGNVIFNSRPFASYFHCATSVTNTSGYKIHFASIVEMHSLIAESIKGKKIARLCAYHAFRIWEGKIRVSLMKDNFFYFFKLFSMYPFHSTIFLLKRFPMVLAKFILSLT